MSTTNSNDPMHSSSTAGVHRGFLVIRNSSSNVVLQSTLVTSNPLLYVSATNIDIEPGGFVSVSVFFKAQQDDTSFSSYNASTFAATTPASSSRSSASGSSSAYLHLGYVMVTCPHQGQESVVDIRQGNASNSSCFSFSSYSRPPTLPRHISHYLTTTQQHQHMPKDEVMPPIRSHPSRGVFFRLPTANFGTTTVGSLTRLKLELCNALDVQVTVFLRDPSLPFVLLHEEVQLRARAYVRLPIRFVPIAAKEYTSELVAQTADASFLATIMLQGNAINASHDTPTNSGAVAVEKV